MKNRVFMWVLAVLSLAGVCGATVSDNYTPLSYTCNGSTTNFTVSWPFWETDDLIVTVTDSDGVITTLTEGAGAGKYQVYAANSDYTSGARVYTGTAYASGNTVTIYRNVDYDQELSIGGDFVPAKPLERQLDKIVAQIQQVDQSQTAGLSIVSNDLDTAEAAITALETQTNLIQSAVQPTDSDYTNALALAGSALQSESDPAWHSGTNTIYEAIADATDAVEAELEYELAVVSGRVTAVEGYTNEAHTAYGWGNHGAAGYAAIDSGTATNLTVSAVLNLSTNEVAQWRFLIGTNSLTLQAWTGSVWTNKAKWED